VTAPTKPLTPDVEAKVKRILDGAARRLLDERLKREAAEGTRSVKAKVRT
jgi:hypothetical protein